MTSNEHLLLLLVSDALLHGVANSLPHQLVYRIMDARRAIDDEAFAAHAAQQQPEARTMTDTYLAHITVRVPTVLRVGHAFAESPDWPGLSVWPSPDRARVAEALRKRLAHCGYAYRWLDFDELAAIAIAAMMPATGQREPPEGGYTASGGPGVSQAAQQAYNASAALQEVWLAQQAANFRAAGIETPVSPRPTSSTA